MKRNIYLKYLNSLEEVNSYEKNFEEILNLSENFRKIKKISMVVSCFVFVMIFNNLNPIALPMLFAINLLINFIFKKTLDNKKESCENNLDQKVFKILVAIGYNFNIKDQMWYNRKNPNYKFKIQSYDEDMITLEAEHNIEYQDEIGKVA